MAYTDKHALPVEPGSGPTAGTGKRQMSAPGAEFNVSVGHGAASGGAGKLNGDGSGDPMIAYKTASGWAKNMGRGGAFGTPFHQGKSPAKYDAGLDGLLDEY